MSIEVVDKKTKSHSVTGRLHPAFNVLVVFIVFSSIFFLVFFLSIFSPSCFTFPMSAESGGGKPVFEGISPNENKAF